jgi:hypothetical protein
MAAAGAALWGGAVLCTATANLVNRRYGREFLAAIASVYPGYHARRSTRQVATGVLLATIDGAVAGAMFAAVYNRFSGPKLRDARGKAA